MATPSLACVLHNLIWKCTDNFKSQRGKCTATFSSVTALVTWCVSCNWQVTSYPDDQYSFKTNFNILYWVGPWNACLWVFTSVVEVPLGTPLPIHKCFCEVTYLHGTFSPPMNCGIKQHKKQSLVKSEEWARTQCGQSVPANTKSSNPLITMINIPWSWVN